MKNITVIGAGTMGNGIAHVFAQSGFNVQLFDISEAALDRALLTIGKNMDRQVAKERISESDKNMAGLLYTSDAADELPCVDLGGGRSIKKKKQRHTNTKITHTE